MVLAAMEREKWVEPTVRRNVAQPTPSRQTVGEAVDMAGMGGASGERLVVCRSSKAGQT